MFAIHVVCDDAQGLAGRECYIRLGKAWRADQIDVLAGVGIEAERVEDATSLGKVYTPAEQRAAQPNPQPLGPNDPLPVTLIKAETHSGQPMLVSVPIKME